MQASMRRRAAAIVIVLGALVTPSLAGAEIAAPPSQAQGTTQRVSVSSSGREGNEGAWEPALSADGRYVAFSSRASNLVPGDNNQARDVFVRDLVAGSTRLVSVASDGSRANGDSELPDISADGRYVVFDSGASNLVAGDTNDERDVFVRDLRSGTTQRLSVSTTGAQADDSADLPTISADGRYIAFQSYARNLSKEHSYGGVFVKDRRTGVLELVSVNSREVPGNGDPYNAQISADGRFVSFSSSFWRNFNETSGRGITDTFLRDRLRGTTRLVSTVPAGQADSKGFWADRESFNCGVSADGRYVAFSSDAPKMIPGGTMHGRSHVYLRDMRRGTTRLIDRSRDGSEGDGYAPDCALSRDGDGRFVVFASNARNLVQGDTSLRTERRQNVFVWNRRTDKIVLVSVNNAGVRPDHGVLPWPLAISATGRVVAFATGATNLVHGDTNHSSDVFIRDR